MKRMLVCTILITLAATALADTDWASLSYTQHNAYQAVDGTGNGTFLPSSDIKLKGVIINNPEEILDETSGAPGTLGGQWQIFIQAVEPGDWSGTACFMGELYGNLPWVPPFESYTETEWAAEMARLNYDPAGGHHFRKGDLVEVRARVPGLFYKGKANVNEAHSKSVDNDFDIILLQADYGMPEPTIIPSLLVANSFDSTRSTGGERYQSTWVRINGVQITGGTWAAGNTVTINDGTDDFAMLLSSEGDFADYPAPTGTFDVLGVFDQEALTINQNIDNTTGYRLWVTQYADLIPAFSPVDYDIDDDVDGDDLNIFEACRTAPGIPATDDCQKADLDGDEDVDQADFALFQKDYTG